MKKLVRHSLILWVLIACLFQSAAATTFLVPGGEILGLELQDSTVTVAAFDKDLGSTAKKAGLQVGDKILKVNEKPVTCVRDLRDVLMKSNGTVDVVIQRGSKQRKFHLSPEITSEGPKLGVYLKEGVSGIGTVSWYNPENGEYGALGHGVNTSGGELLKMQSGKAFEATIISVKKGQTGAPGQLVGSIEATAPVGTIGKNTLQGVFGKTDRKILGEKLPVASPGEIRMGDAVIRSTVENNSLREYSVEILKIYPNAKESGRNLLLRVTDPALLEITGGIVQGMSGSPIIQDGKLVGAVTHVLVNDPTTGYGIFIENMLDAAA